MTMPGMLSPSTGNLLDAWKFLQLSVGVGAEMTSKLSYRCIGRGCVGDEISQTDEGKHCRKDCGKVLQYGLWLGVWWHKCLSGGMAGTSPVVGATS